MFAKGLASPDFGDLLEISHFIGLDATVKMLDKFDFDAVATTITGIPVGDKTCDYCDNTATEHLDFSEHPDDPYVFDVCDDHAFEVCEAYSDNMTPNFYNAACRDSYDLAFA